MSWTVKELALKKGIFAVVNVVWLSAALAVPQLAWAQDRRGGAGESCRNNADCEAPLRCRGLVCRDPNQAAPAPVPAPAPAPVPDPAAAPVTPTAAAVLPPPPVETPMAPPGTLQPYGAMTMRPQTSDGGWAYGASVYGIINSILILGTGFTAEYLAHASGVGNVPGTSTGAVALTLGLVGVPIVAAGASSARRSSSASGSTGLRISGWISYGISAALGIALIGLGVSNIQPKTGIISATTVTLTYAQVAMTIDGFMSHSEAVGSSRASIAPQIMPVSNVHGGGMNGALLGVGGAF